MMSCINTTEFWPIWIALLWFILVIILRVIFNIGPTDFITWSYNYEFADQITSANFLLSTGIIIILTYISLIVCHKCLRVKIYYTEYYFVMSIVLISKFVGTSMLLKSYGLGTAFWCICLGCCFRTVFKINLDLMMSMEFFIKTSIVLFAIELDKIINLGAKSLVVAWVETCLLLFTVYCIGRYILNLDITKTLLLSSGLSICGSSAVMSVSDIMDRNTPRLNYDTSVTITILSILSIPYIIVVPYLCKKFGFSDIISGTWIGGSIDSTGAVIASASLVNKTTTDNAILLKMLQNLLIGPIVLGFTGILYRSVNPKILIQKFPKFIVAFLIVSIIVTTLPNGLGKSITQDCIVLSEWFSQISFVLIGMGINLLEIPGIIKNEWRMLVLYIIGQTIDTLTTLGFSIWMFSN
jgi:uncharacterized membrane protein YadS